MSSGEPIQLAVEGHEAAQEMLRKLAPASGVSLEFTFYHLAQEWKEPEVRAELERQVRLQTNDPSFTLADEAKRVKKLQCIIESLTTRKDDNAYFAECGKHYGFPRLLEDKSAPNGVVVKPAEWDFAGRSVTHQMYAQWRAWQLSGQREFNEGAVWWKFTQEKTLEEWKEEHTERSELHSLVVHMVLAYAKRIRRAAAPLSSSIVQ